MVNRNFCKGETLPQKLKSIQDDLSQAFKKIEMKYRELLEEFAVEFKVAHIKFVTSAEAEQSASQKPAGAGRKTEIDKEAQKEIPPERKTVPLSLSRMAQYWGGDMTPIKIKSMINTGILKVIKLGRQSFIFDTKLLPKHVIEKVTK